MELWDYCPDESSDALCLDGSSEIGVLKGVLRWLFWWWEICDCCFDMCSQTQNSHQDNNLRPPIKTTISELPSRQQSQSSHQDNKLKAPIKTTIWELPSRQQSQSSHQDNNLRAPIKTAISELPSRQQSQSSHQDNNLSAPIKTTILELPSRQQSQSSDLCDCFLNGSATIFVLMGALSLLSWWELYDCCLDGRS
jgi:hypothetical protein